MTELTKYDWKTAVGLHPVHKRCALDLRVANVLMQKTDADTGFMWASQQTIAEWAGTADERQVRTVMNRLVSTGAIKRSRIADLQPDMLVLLQEKMSSNRNKRGVVYKLQMFWAFETFEAYRNTKVREPDQLRKNRELKRTTIVRSERTTIVRSGQDSGSPAYTTSQDYNDTEAGRERKEDLASTREGNPYAMVKGKAA